MQLQQIMRTNFDVVSANDFAEDALLQMRNHGHDSLFVIDGQRIIGVLLLEEMEQQPFEKVKDAAVRDFVSTNAWRVSPETSVREATRLLKGRSNACLFVTWDEQPIGFVTQSELLRAVELSGSQTRPASARSRQSSGSQDLHRALRPARH